jgi:hypothetical protein
MAVNDVSRLVVVGWFQDQNIVNTFHYKHTVQASEEREVLQELCLQWQAANTIAWLARHSDAYSFVGIKAFRHTGAGKVPGHLLIGELGAIDGTANSSFVSRNITLYTDSANHRRRGRIQISGSITADFDEITGAVLAAQVVLMQALANTLLDPLTGPDDTWELCIPPTDADPTEVITAARARATPGVIRSRRIKSMFIG